MRGEKVIIRAFRDVPLIGIVWRTEDQAVLICSEANFQRLINDEEGLWPVGFPRSDVFRYDAVQADMLIKGLENDPAWWEKLSPWSEEEYQATDP
jgi:hypothetical protein